MCKNARLIIVRAIEYLFVRDSKNTVFFETTKYFGIFFIRPSCKQKSHPDIIKMAIYYIVLL